MWFLSCVIRWFWLFSAVSSDSYLEADVPAPRDVCAHPGLNHGGRLVVHHEAQVVERVVLHEHLKHRLSSISNPACQIADVFNEETVSGPGRNISI